MRPTPDGRRWLSACAVAAPTVLAAALVTWTSANTPLWRDEFATRQYASMDLPDLLAATSHVDAVLVPYYALIHALSGLTGFGAGMRIWSALAFVAAVALIGMLALRWWGRTAAATAATMLAANGSVLAQATNARPYTLALCGIALATFCLDLALRDPSTTSRDRRAGPALSRTGSGIRVLAWIGYAVAALVAVLLQPFAATALVATVVLVRSRRSLVRWVLTSAPWAAATVLVLMAGRGQTDQLAWVTPAGPMDVSRNVTLAAGLADGRLPVHATLIALMAILAVSLSTRRRPVVFAAAVVAMPVVLLVAVSLLVHPVVNWRYLLWVALGVALLAGAAVGVLVRGRGPILVRLAPACIAIGLVATMAWNAIGGVFLPSPRRDDFPAAVSRIQNEARIGDLLIVVQRYEQGGVTLGFADAARDDAFVDEVVADAVHGLRPALALRSVTSVHPLRTAPARPGDPDPVADPARSLWVVSIWPAEREDPSTLPPAVAACYREANDATLVAPDPTRVYRITCG